MSRKPEQQYQTKRRPKVVLFILSNSDDSINLGQYSARRRFCCSPYRNSRPVRGYYLTEMIIITYMMSKWTCRMVSVWNLQADQSIDQLPPGTFVCCSIGSESGTFQLEIHDLSKASCSKRDESFFRGRLRHLYYFHGRLLFVFQITLPWNWVSLL